MKKQNILIKVQYLFILFFISSSFTFAQENVENESYESRLEKVKKRVKESIDTNAFDEDSKKRRYKVVFEGNYMRLLIMKANGSAPINKGLLYDFSKVDRFDEISYRRKNKAYINVRTFFLDKEKYKRKKWVRIKLIMKVFTHESAELIMNALKDYNKILLEKKLIKDESN